MVGGPSQKFTASCGSYKSLNGTNNKGRFLSGTHLGNKFEHTYLNHRLIHCQMFPRFFLKTCFLIIVDFSPQQQHLEKLV